MSGAGDEETQPALIPSTGPANTQPAQIQVTGPAEIQPVPAPVAGPAETRPVPAPVAGPAETQPVPAPVAGPAETQPVPAPVAGPAETQTVLPGLMTGNKESTPYKRLFFSVNSQHGNPITQERDCDLNYRILGLKNKFAKQFGATADAQKWYIGNVLLENNRNLVYYGINNMSKGIIIRVEINN